MDFPSDSIHTTQQIQRTTPSTSTVTSVSLPDSTQPSISLTQPRPGLSVIPSPTSTSLQSTNEPEPQAPVIQSATQDAKYIDITEYLNLPQSQAAKKLTVPTSTLSKRWKEAVRNRKWPYRAVCKLDKEIMTILYNIPQSPDAQTDDLPPDVKAKLGRLLRERQDLLKPVIIRL